MVGITAIPGVKGSSPHTPAHYTASAESTQDEVNSSIIIAGSFIMSKYTPGMIMIR